MWTCRDLPSAKPPAFAPAGDLLSWAPKKEGKEAAPNAWPFGSAAVLRFAGPRPTHFARLARCVQTKGAKSALEGAARRPPKPALLAQARRGKQECPVHVTDGRPMRATRRCPSTNDRAPQQAVPPLERSKPTVRAATLKLGLEIAQKL
jgi:hypothetical protein